MYSPCNANELIFQFSSVQSLSTRLQAVFTQTRSKNLVQEPCFAA